MVIFCYKYKILETIANLNDGHGVVPLSFSLVVSLASAHETDVIVRLQPLPMITLPC